MDLTIVAKLDLSPQDKVVGLVIDLLVTYFNKVGFFPKGK